MCQEHGWSGGKGARDGTKYGAGRHATRSYLTHHTQRIALAASRHMHEYGTTSEQLAEIAVATRHWASMNPLARMRDRITIDDVMNSRMIASPLHLLDCCLVTDAGGAVVSIWLQKKCYDALKAVMR